MCIRVVPDIQPFLYLVTGQISGFICQLAGYSTRKTVKNQEQFWQIKLYPYITGIYITILYYFVDKIYHIIYIYTTKLCKQMYWKLDKGNFFGIKILYYYLSGYPAISVSRATLMWKHIIIAFIVKLSFEFD